MQRSRKELNLNVSDRISLRFDGEAKLEDAIVEHSAYLAKETLATDFGRGELAGESFSAKIDGMDLRYSIVRN